MIGGKKILGKIRDPKEPLNQGRIGERNPLRKKYIGGEKKE